MLIGLKHIGYAVKSIDETVERWKRVYGAEEIKRNTFSDIGQTSALVRIGTTYFELMEPVPGVEKSTVRKYLDTHGEGFHHLSFKSDNLSEDIERMKGEGVKIIGEGFPIVFTHPKTTGGTVLEITEQDD